MDFDAVGQLDEDLREFLIESNENLANLDREIVELERTPEDQNLISAVFRTIHTIKGTCGFFDFNGLGSVAHIAENILCQVREEHRPLTPELISLILEAVDQIKIFLVRIEADGKEGEDDAEELRARLNEAHREFVEQKNSAKPAQAERLQTEVSPHAEDQTVATGIASVSSTDSARVTGSPNEHEGEFIPSPVPAVNPQLVAEPAKPDVIPEPMPNATRDANEVAATPKAEPEKKGGDAHLAESTIRVDVGLLNKLMNLVGELVLARNQLVQETAALNPTLLKTSQRLNLITSELQEGVMKTRMQPIGVVWNKLPRVVRDLAAKCGKTVQIEMQGAGTELDKTIIEAIKDPLTHIVRNAIDHGIEEPRARALAGKPLEGVVNLRAYHHNGTVVIEVEDDGGGISTARVLAKAIERGLVTEEQAAAMTEREALQLVFQPGFSTAAKITHVSGRGVGMDVVLSNVEKVGGTVEIESREGKGTLLRLRVPLTLAIVRALVVRSGGQSFCLPQSALAELVYVPWREVVTSVEWIGEAELFRLRERLLPMVRLDRVLGLDGHDEHRQAHGFYLVVLESEGCEYGLVVDDLMAPEEIVVKPLSPVLRQIGLFSGATVLGSGSLAMILDIAQTAAKAGIRPGTQEAEAAKIPVAAPAIASSSFLIFEDGAPGHTAQRMALPLSVVVRIESVDLKNVEWAGDRPLLQYRGELLPLEDRGGVLRELKADDPEPSATVLICQKSGRGPERRMGMVVRRVVEVATGDLMAHNAEICTDRLAMVNERLTVVHEAFAGWEKFREVA